MLSISQTEVRAYESSIRSVVGLAGFYPANLLADFHTHPKAQLLYAVSGAMRVETPTEYFIIPPSTALILPANTLHSILMDGPVDRRTLFLKEPSSKPTFPITKVIAVTGLLRELINEICKEPFDWSMTSRANNVAMLTLDEIKRANTVPLGLRLPNDVRLRRVVNGIKANPSDTRSFSAWAEMTGASERTLARLFRSETGLNFRQWRQHARLTMAMSLLSNGRNLSEAAAASGFENQSAFGVSFRRFFGITPGQALRRGLARLE